MKVFLAQTKPYLGDIEKNLEEMVKIIERQIEEKTDIVVFPELSLTGYLLEELVFDVAIQKVPRIFLKLSKKISILFGAVELSNNNSYYNTAYYLEDGKVRYKHRKVYLPNYGIFNEIKYFEAGDSIKAFDTKFGRLGILINEDALDQSSSYILGQDGASTIFILANSSLELTSVGLERCEMWSCIGKSIAVSNRCNVIFVNRVGVEDGITFYGKSFTLTSKAKLLKELDLLKECGKKVDFNESSKSILTKSYNKNLDLVFKELSRIKKD